MRSNRSVYHYMRWRIQVCAPKPRVELITFERDSEKIREQAQKWLKEENEDNNSNDPRKD